MPPKRICPGRAARICTRLKKMAIDADTIFMRMALREAMAAADEGEVPIGAVIVCDDAVLGKAHNQVETLRDPTAHAEILAITQAADALGDWRLLDTRLYVTKEPCPMCSGAIVSARISEVVWGVDDPKRGGASVFDILDHPGLNHRPRVRSGLMIEDCREILQNFFSQRRREATWK